MRSFRPWLLVLLAVTAACTLGTELARAGSDEDPRVEVARSRAMEHYHSGEYAAFVEGMEAVTAHSDNDTDDYNLACGYALNGQADAALDKLRYLVDRGYAPDLADDSDFGSLRARPEYYQLVAQVAFQEEADRQLEPVRDLARQRYDAEQYDVYVQIMEKVAKVSNTDVDLYNLACGYALNGQADDAIAALDRLADRGGDYGAAGDSDFASLRSDPRFHAVLARL